MQWQDRRVYRGIRNSHSTRERLSAIVFALFVCAGHAQTFRGAISGTRHRSIWRCNTERASQSYGDSDRASNTTR